MAEHSRFGGSVADRVIGCPGSVSLCATVPNISSVQAMIGTAAHALAAECLTTDTDAEHYRGEFFPRDAPSREKFIVEDDMIRAVQVYLDEVRSELALSDDAMLFVEHGFELSLQSADPGEVFGTNDAMVYHPSTGRLRVFDYKHGQGVSVSAEDNAQLKFYATGAVYSNPAWSLDEVILTIVQPRARDADAVGQVKDWPMDTLELMAFQATYDEAVRRAKVGDQAFNLGSWCRWCDAAAICPLKNAQALEIAGADFADVAMVTTANLPDPKTLDTERLAKIVAGVEILNAWAAQCQQLLEGLVLNGHAVPGWKAVEKIGRAKWVEDPEKIVAEATLMWGLDEEQVRPPKLVTITEMERLLKTAGAKKPDLDAFKLQFTMKESSGLTVAPDSDKRPAVNAAERDFGSVTI